MSEPSEEAKQAANKMEAAFHCDGRDTKRFAAIIQQAIDAANAKLLDEAAALRGGIQFLWDRIVEKNGEIAKLREEIRELK